MPTKKWFLPHVEAENSSWIVPGLETPFGVSDARCVGIPTSKKSALRALFGWKMKKDDLEIVFKNGKSAFEVLSK